MADKIIAVHAFKTIDRAVVYSQVGDKFVFSYVLPDGSKDWDVTFRTEEAAKTFFERELARDRAAR